MKSNRKKKVHRDKNGREFIKETYFVGGKMKFRRIYGIDGIPADEFYERNATDLDFYLNGDYELMNSEKDSDNHCIVQNKNDKILKSKYAMIDSKVKEIRGFCEANSNPDIIKTYQRYFKEGYDGYGIDDKVFKQQIEIWVEQWKDEMTIESYLSLGDDLMKNGRFDEKHIAISFLKSSRKDFSKDTFNRVGAWFDYGINNWATTDVLCMLVLSSLLFDKIIDFNDLKSWIDSESEWKRRAVPVALIELDKLTKDLKSIEAIELVEPLMLDDSEYVQKGIGTLLRGLWKKYPSQIEDFLMKWKDKCGRLIIQYSTEKMDKEYRKKFSRIK